jgi:ABC-type antimicrobial peptide transport system permease subunit
MSSVDISVEGPAPVVRDRTTVQAPRLSIRDLVDEMVSGLLGRPGRLVLTALGTVLGITALVSTLGLAATAGNQIVSRFDELSETRVVVSPTDTGFGGQAGTSNIPWNAEARLTRLNGVVAAGTKSDVDISGALSKSVPVVDPLGINEHQISVVAGSGGLLEAVRGTIRTGRFFDEGHNERRDPVVVLGPAAAQRLNVFQIDIQPAIFIGEQAFVVIGIIDDVAREPDLLNAIVMPDGTAREYFGLAAPAEVHVDAEVGATQVVAGQAAIALAPGNEDSLRVQASQGYTAVRQDVEENVNALFIVLGGVSLLVGGLGIANVTLVSVLERTPEIGLRRALGAARRHIASQFLLESTVTGLLGGIIGASVGVLVIVVVSAVRDWTPVLESWLPFAAVGLGALIGLIAGTYPAVRAAKTEPITALRSG